MIRVTRRVIRFMGWLLTPLVAWAAAFLGGWLGAMLAEGIVAPRTGMAIMVAGAGTFAAAATWLWARGIRRSARLQAWGRRRIRSVTKRGAKMDRGKKRVSRRHSSDSVNG